VRQVCKPHLLNSIKEDFGDPYSYKPDVVRPKFIKLFELINHNENYRSEFIHFFSEMIKTLQSTNDYAVFQPILYILNTCMTYLKWPEIGEQLKSAYANVFDLHVKLKIEMTIRLIYDRNWIGGNWRLKDGEAYNDWNIFESIEKSTRYKRD